MTRLLKNLLEYPATSGLDLDAPETTLLRRQVIHQKPFLHQIYREWYQGLAAALPGSRAGLALELGAGGGYMKEWIPNLVASEVFFLSQLDLVADGLALPFPSGSLRAIVMTNVFHHLPRPRRFLEEAQRCLATGGVIAMLEPWVTSWSRWVYSRLHHEDFLPDVAGWELPAGGPLSTANNALPWVVFERDHSQFEQDFPSLHIREITLMMPFRYLVSGGVSLRSLAPGWSFTAWSALEKLLAQQMPHLAMFARVVIERD
jgi:SAM-dependent methyltransferase